jgi:polyisoprenoid-binding protein YceI
MIRALFLPPSLVASLLAASLLVAAPARAEHFAIDPVHTRVAFQVSHAGFSRPVGTFSGVHGSLDFERGDWSHAQVDVRIPVDTLDLGDADWQKRILDPTFFNAKKFPEARFVSTKVESTGTDTATVTGDLTLHGVTHPVVLQVKFNQLARHPLTFRRTAGFSATATLSRKDFGMDNWSRLVGDEVTLVLEVEASRERQPGEPRDDNDKERNADGNARTN